MSGSGPIGPIVLCTYVIILVDIGYIILKIRNGRLTEEHNEVYANSVRWPRQH